MSSFSIWTNPFSDERAVEKAIHKIKNDSDFFASECIDLIRKAADWSISFAAGIDEKKRAFLEDISQGKGREFLRNVLDAYENNSDSSDARGRCGYSIGSNDYLSSMERDAFGKELPAMNSARWGGSRL